MSLNTPTVTPEGTNTSELDTNILVKAKNEEASTSIEAEAPISLLAGSIKREDLLDALAIVMKAVSSRSTLPILAHVHITLQTIPEGGTILGRAILTCTNLEIALRREIEACVINQGSYTVPAKLLQECVNALPKGGVVTLTTDEGSLHITSGKRRYRLKGAQPDEFPSWPVSDEDENSSIDLEAATLRTAIKETEFAAADDDSRPVFTGVHWSVSDGRLTMAAADPFRLAVREIPLTRVPGSNASILIPAKTLKTLALLLPPSGKTKMHWYAKSLTVLFRAGATQMVSRLIEATFPNVRAVIPKESHTIATIERAVLTSALKGIAPFARDNSNITRLFFKIPETNGNGATTDGDGEIRSGTVTIEAAAEDVGDSSEEMQALVEGSTNGEILVNYRYLSDILTQIPESAFTFGYTTKDRPILIRPFGRDDYWYVLMPMK